MASTPFFLMTDYRCGFWAGSDYSYCISFSIIVITRWIQNHQCGSNFMFCFIQWVISFAVARSSCKRSRASLVWTLCSKSSSENDRNTRHYQKVLPQLFPWKRATFASSFNSSSVSAIRYLSFHIASCMYVYLFALFWLCASTVVN